MYDFLERNSWKPSGLREKVEFMSLNPTNVHVEKSRRDRLDAYVVAGVGVNSGVLNNGVFCKNLKFMGCLMGLMKSVFYFVFVSLSACCGLGHAATVSRTVNFSDTVNTSGDGEIFHANSSGLIGTGFNPFVSSLGTLRSFQIDWTVTIFAMGTTSASGGNLSQSLGGQVYLNTTAYNGMGGGNNTGGGPNAPIGPILAVATATNSFLVSEAGTSYDPALLAAVTGGSSFDLKYVSPVKTSYATMASVFSEMSGSVTLTYTYDPAPNPVPEPTSLAIGSVLFTGLIAMRRRRRQS
ncbi:MAG: hypothetical protein ACOYOZ_10535 [Pirellula sp.]